jgi:NAD(P)-dependent dehydrogenase (short-subunit alcohol dehydrogenase family)
VTTPLPVALVTGCSRAEGIGFEVCRQLAQQDITVLLTARDASKAAALASSLRDQGLDVSGHQLDISSAASVQAIVKHIDERHGRLDILVNNATGATRSPDPASSADLDAAQQVVDVTLFGTWRLIQATLPLLQKSETARIVNVSSSAGLHSDPDLGLGGEWSGRPAYGIAKAALNALTVKFAAELRDTDIKVNAVCPGLTATHPGMAARGARAVPEGARGIVWAATLDQDGPSGGFYRDNQRQEW